MLKRGLPGRHSPSAIAVVEPPVFRAYTRRARVAFLATASACGVLVAATLSVATPAVVAVFLGVVCGVGCGLTVGALVLVWPVLRALWHWAFEIATAGTLVALAIALSSATHPLAAVVVAGALSAVVAAVSPVRRRVTAWLWCVVVRHRLRLCFAEFVRGSLRTRPMVLPLIAWVWPTPAGERVWVWLRPGLDLADLESKTGRLAVACWAGEVRVVRASKRYAALVRVDMTRRDPLTGVVTSPLAGQVPDPVTAVLPVSPALPPLGLDLPDVPEDHEPAPPVRARR